MSKHADLSSSRLMLSFPQERASHCWFHFCLSDKRVFLRAKDDTVRNA